MAHVGRQFVVPHHVSVPTGLLRLVEGCVGPTDEAHRVVVIAVDGVRGADGHGDGVDPVGLNPDGARQVLAETLRDDMGVLGVVETGNDDELVTAVAGHQVVLANGAREGGGDAAQ